MPGIGVGVHGQRNWIRLVGPFRLQPSEFAKLALILWSADLFARREAYLHQWRALLVPFMPVVAVVVGLVVLEGDLGTAIVMSIIVAGAAVRRRCPDADLRRASAPWAWRASRCCR